MQAVGALGAIPRLVQLLQTAETRNVAAIALATCVEGVPANQTAAAAAIPTLVDMLAGPPGDPLRYDSPSLVVFFRSVFLSSCEAFFVFLSRS